MRLIAVAAAAAMNSSMTNWYADTQSTRLRQSSVVSLSFCRFNDEGTRNIHLHEFKYANAVGRHGVTVPDNRREMRPLLFV